MTELRRRAIELPLWVFLLTSLSACIIGGLTGGACAELGDGALFVDTGISEARLYLGDVPDDATRNASHEAAADIEFWNTEMSRRADCLTLDRRIDSTAMDLANAAAGLNVYLDNAQLNRPQP